jgi:hypothetical protein
MRMSLVDDELASLERLFPRKRLLSPADVAPLIGKSPRTLANQRALGIHVLPVTKVGRSVGFHIRVVAYFLALGKLPPEFAAESDSSTVSQPKHPKVGSPAPKSRKQGLTTRNWILALKQTLELNQELASRVERELLLAKHSKVVDKKPSVITDFL